jgi:hypothetical protein
MPSAPRAEPGPWRRRILIALAAAGLTALTFHPLCDLAFACGCRWAWAGGDAHCDIRMPGAPDCPVCADMRLGAAFTAALAAAWGAAAWGVARVAAGSRR